MTTFTIRDRDFPNNRDVEFEDGKRLDDVCPAFAKIKPENQDALIGWYNVRIEDIDADDLERLAELWNAKQFRWWECPTCGEEVYEGEPEDWGHFQGVQQNDRASYPGIRPRDKRCDHCRCYDKR